MKPTPITISIFTKWFHDLYRPSHRPYDPREIEVIKRFSRFADEVFRNR